MVSCAPGALASAARSAAPASSHPERGSTSQRSLQGPAMQRWQSVCSAAALRLHMHAHELRDPCRPTTLAQGTEPVRFARAVAAPPRQPRQRRTGARRSGVLVLLPPYRRSTPARSIQHRRRSTQRAERALEVEQRVQRHRRMLRLSPSPMSVAAGRCCNVLLPSAPRAAPLRVHMAALASARSCVASGSWAIRIPPKREMEGARRAGL